MIAAELVVYNPKRCAAWSCCIPSSTSQLWFLLPSKYKRFLHSIIRLSSSHWTIQYSRFPRGCPTTRQALRSDTSRASIAWPTALRFLSGVTTFLRALPWEWHYPTRDPLPASSAGCFLLTFLWASWLEWHPFPHFPSVSDNRSGHWIGTPILLMFFSLAYLLVKAQGSDRSFLYYIQISLMLIWLIVLFLVDYVYKYDFRQFQWMVISYVMLAFAGMGGMIGVASLAGREWTISSVILFLIVAILAFVQRAVTGIWPKNIRLCWKPINTT